MFRPNLAGKYDPELIKFPGFSSPKIDGLRCLAMGGKAMSRKMLPLPNKYLQSCFADGRCDGLDGELVVGEPNAPDVYRTSNSGIMSVDGRPDFTFLVFDRWDMLSGAPYSTRLACLNRGPLPYFVEFLKQDPINSTFELDVMESTYLESGYEGAMYRSATGLYKQGRSTSKEGGLLKIKRFLDAEAEIIGFEEKMHNANEATINELGHTKRSSHQANKHGLNTLGALVCRGVTAFPGIQFNVGTGFDDATRNHFWATRDVLRGKHIKFKYFDVGVKDAPRHPVFLGMRELGT